MVKNILKIGKAYSLVLRMMNYGHIFPYMHDRIRFAKNMLYILI